MDSSRKLKIAITGTTSGIGKATAELLADKHSIWCINRPKYDLLDDTVLNAIDLSGYDVLVNNAGADYARQNFITHEYKDWQNTVKINLIVPMYLTQKFLQQNSNGTIINITSTGNQKMPTTNSSVFYRSSKQALKHFTQEINDCSATHRIIDIEPGKTDTNFTKNAGTGKDYSMISMSPMEIAKAVEMAIYTKNITHIRIK